MLAAGGARRVAFEDPSHDKQWEAARRAGLEPVPVPVDDDGIRVEPLAEADPDAVVVTPAHQFPTGVGAARRAVRALLAWAARRGALVIEDDYDAEFRYDRAPVGALQGLDAEHVAYVGTRSPRPWRPRCGSAGRWSRPSCRDVVDGEAATPTPAPPSSSNWRSHACSARRAYDRDVPRARIAYRRRRDALLEALRSSLPDCAAEGIAAGLHVLVRLPAGADAAEIAAAAAGRRLHLRPVADFSLTPRRPRSRPWCWATGACRSRRSRRRCESSQP